MFAYLQYLIIKAFSLFINLLPEGLALLIGRWLGILAFYLDREHRKVTLQNLNIAFGNEKSQEEILTIARRTFKNLGMMAVEFLSIAKMDLEDFKRKVSVEGLEEVRKIKEESKKGGLLLLSHFGNWELMGMLSRFLDLPVAVVARPIKKNRYIDRMVMEIRKSAGLNIIQKERAIGNILRALSENYFVGILIDQRARRSEGVWVDFFGRKAPTTPSLAILAMRTGVPILPIFMVRNGYRKHLVLIKRPLSLVHTGDIKKDIITNTQIINETLESIIRKYPDQWFWVHRRWERKKKA